jgi:hypothetical protein
MIVPGRAAAIAKDTVSDDGARDVLRSRHAQEALATAVHELSERLTSIGNYLAAGVRLSEIAPPPGTPPPLREALTKALGQSEQANTVIHCYRKLLTKENEMEGDKQGICERAYELWRKAGIRTEKTWNIGCAPKRKLPPRPIPGSPTTAKSESPRKRRCGSPPVPNNRSFRRPHSSPLGRQRAAAIDCYGYA